MGGAKTIPVRLVAPQGRSSSTRTIPVEMPVAIEYNGIGYAVMMATPDDLIDFGIGFTLSEAIADQPSDILEVTPFETDQGWLLKIHLAETCLPRVVNRVRIRASDSSCGLCGLENLEQVNRPLPPVTATHSVSDAALFKAIEALRNHQPLNGETGGAHAAAFCAPNGEIRLTREDVGRHNGLDKLIGALARAGTDPASGFILLSSRCSFELVEKTVIAGCPLLVTISTATSLAVDRAQAAGLALIALARSDTMLDFSAPPPD